MLFRSAAVLLALVLGLLAAGCGSGGKKAATTTTTPPTTTTAASGSSASVLTTLASLGNCPQLANLESSLLAAFTGASGNVQQEIAAIKRAAAKTPAAIRPDFETIASSLGNAADALRGVNLSKATSATITKLMSRLGSPQVTAAVAHISAWAKTHCHA